VSGLVTVVTIGLPCESVSLFRLGDGILGRGVMVLAAGFLSESGFVRSLGFGAVESACLVGGFLGLFVRTVLHPEESCCPLDGAWAVPSPAVPTLWVGESDLDFFAFGILEDSLDRQVPFRLEVQVVLDRECVSQVKQYNGSTCDC
jgi:hypothetical protein